MIAVSHGQSRSNRVFTSTAAASPVFFLFAPAIGIKRILQIMRVRRIDAKGSTFYILQRLNIYFGGEKITHRQQTLNSIDKFARLDFFDLVEQELSPQGRAGKTDCFQNHDLTTA